SVTWVDGTEIWLPAWRTPPTRWRGVTSPGTEAETAADRLEQRRPRWLEGLEPSASSTEEMGPEAGTIRAWEHRFPSRREMFRGRTRSRIVACLCCERSRSFAVRCIRSPKRACRSAIEKSCFTRLRTVRD